MDRETIRDHVRAGNYALSKHAERERQTDKITVAELEEALSLCEVVEQYPDDPRGPSCLVVGFSGKRPVHAVCAVTADPEELLLVTVYDPSKRPAKWTQGYRRRKE